MVMTVIIPAYNEEKTISKVIQDFHINIPEAELIIVDNNSSDKTQEYAVNTINKLNAKGKVIYESRQGKANALRKAFSETNADIYVIVDADLTYPASSVFKLIEPVLYNNADMVVGDRISAGKYQKENKRLFHNFGNKLVRLIINFLFKNNLKDIMSGYRVFNHKFIKNFPILCEGFEIETEMTLHALDKKFKILEIPIDYLDRPEGSISKLNTFRDGFRVLTSIVTIFKDYKPLTFFGLLASICFLSGLIVGFQPVLEFFRESYVYKVPSAILATGLMILGLLFMAIGLILDTVVKIHRFNFELRMLQYKDDRE